MEIRKIGSALVLVLSCAHAEPCAPGVRPLAPNPVTGDICPIVGRMGGYRLAIPSQFVFGPIAYKGIDIWSADSYKKSPQHPTFDNEIDTFAIRIRQTNFKPIETQGDQRQYLQSYQSVWVLPPNDNRWIHVGFDARRYPMPSAREKAESWHQDEAHWGPYVKAADVWALSHYVSVQSPSTDVPGEQVEYFYDAAGNAAFMFCRNTLRKVEPYDLLSNCQIEFNVPELKAYAEITNIRDKADLARWRAMRDGVLRVVDSFIVP